LLLNFFYFFIFSFSIFQKLFLGSVESHFIIIHQKVMVDKQRGDLFLGFGFCLGEVGMFFSLSFFLSFSLPSFRPCPSKLLHTRGLS
jgi:hypothetical protein